MASKNRIRLLAKPTGGVSSFWDTLCGLFTPQRRMERLPGKGGSDDEVGTHANF